MISNALLAAPAPTKYIQHRLVGNIGKGREMVGIGRERSGNVGVICRGALISQQLKLRQNKAHMMFFLMV